MVEICIDRKRRIFNARLHSAGHLLDAALMNLGKADLVPTKGNHSPENPYVEYEGNIPVEERDLLLEELTQECNRLIGENESVETFMEGPVRFVTIAGRRGKCGGTHVKALSEIQSMQVVRIKKSKKLTKISYSVG
eukprot:Sdes_comp19413_c0_seq1m10748